MPVATNKDTPAISIAGMLTYRPQFLLLAGLVNVVTVHDALHSHSLHVVASPSMLGFESLRPLHTVGLTISVPIPVGPLVGAASVQQRETSIGSPTVEECTSDLLHRHLAGAIVAWMREVPVASDHTAFAIGISSMVTNRLHLLSLACLQDIWACHWPTNFSPDELVVAVVEIEIVDLMLGTDSLSILIPVVSPPMGIPNIKQRALPIVTAAIRVSSAHE
jgi:hypothetical protein